MYRPYLFAVILASLLVLAGAALASGSTTTLASVGGWSAFGGTANDGSSVCGMMIKDDATRRYLMIKHFRDDPFFVIQAIRPSWHLQNSVSIDVYMKLDDHPAWKGKGNGYNNTVEWRINRNNIVSFVKEFQYSNKLIVGFPQGTEVPWVASLYGSAAIANVWMRCIINTQAVAASSGPTSPAPTSPAPASPAPAAPPTAPQKPVTNLGPDIGA